MQSNPAQDSLKQAWEEFVLQGRALQATRIRNEILESWKRCRHYGVDPLVKTNFNLDEKDYANRRQGNSDLVEVATPIMEKIYDFVAGTGFVVTLADKEGYLLHVIGDVSALEFTSRSNFKPGAKWGEREAGTNAVGLAIFLDKPVQVYSSEHYCLHAHTSTCSAAPIHDPDSGRLIGILDMTGRCESVHQHTLGIAVAGACSVERQLALGRACKASELANRQKILIMDSMSDGVLTLDCEGRLLYMNKKAAQMLKVPFPAQCWGQSLDQLLGETGEKHGYKRLIDIFRERREIVDELISVGEGEGSQFTVTVHGLLDADGSRSGAVAVLQEISRVNKLVRQMGGWSAKTTFENLFGQDPVFQKAIRLGQKAAPSMCNVLLLGETGSGKDVLAQAIHNASARRTQPFVAINCAVIPRDLLASELFGYTEGAFTGAKKGGNPGKFELADGGTLFLDEIGEMPLDMQSALLRVLEERSVIRVGGRDVIPVDVRIIAATNKDLQAEVQRGNFRQDLFFRLNVLSIWLPPLRERRQDIGLLAQQLLERACERMGRKLPQLSSEVLSLFMAHAWPGNIREMQNVIERALHLLECDVLTADLLPDEMRTPGLPRGPENGAPALQSVEQATIMTYLAQFGYNRTLVARKLGISRSTLYRKLREYGIDQP